MWNVSCRRVFIGQREITPLAIYCCVCTTVCVCCMYVSLCALSVGGRGSRYYSEREEKEIEKRPFGAPCPVLAWFLRIPCRNWSVISFTPHSFSSLLTKHAHTQAHPSVHVDLQTSCLTYFSVNQQDIVLYSKKMHCVVWMPQAFSISARL